MKLSKLTGTFLIALFAISLSIFIGSETFGNSFQNTESSIKNIIYNNRFEIELTDQERDWLKQKPVIKLGIDRAFPPFGSITKDQEYIGFSADVMRMIEHRLGFKFDIKIDAPWDKTMRMAKAGQVDMISALVNSEQRQKFLNIKNQFVDRGRGFRFH